MQKSANVLSLKPFAHEISQFSIVRDFVIEAAAHIAVAASSRRVIVVEARWRIESWKQHFRIPMRKKTNTLLQMVRI